MKKRIVFTVVVLLVILGINIVTYRYVSKKNRVLFDKTFVFSGTGYYAVEHNRNVNVSFVLIDTKGIVGEIADGQYKGTLCGSEETGRTVALDEVKISLLNAYNSYSVYRITCELDSRKLSDGAENFFALKLIGRTGDVLFDLPIGNVIVERIEETEPCSQIDIGYFLIEDTAGEYRLYVDNNSEETLRIDGILFKTAKGKVLGEWSNGCNTVEAGEKGAELSFMFDTKENLTYIQPVVFYTVGNKQHSEIAKASTSYMGEIGKEDIIEYIEENLQ